MTGRTTPGHVGIVACSAEGAALCYRTFCTEAPALMGSPHAHPEVSLHGLSLADQMDRIYADDWAGLGEMMLVSAARLASIGAQVLICPDNTIHQALALVRDRSPLPWLHIAEVVAAEARARGFRRIGLLGTRWLVDSRVYPDALDAAGIGWVRPSEAARDAMNRVIMDELVCGVTSASQTELFQAVVSYLKAEGCDAVVMGCTEIPLVLSDVTSPLPTLDSTRLLARAALRWAVAG
jgi:aspartate racemase